ncbi:MAG: hypothetical protein AAB850_01265 [Patescibacteria group bacterium]
MAILGALSAPACVGAATLSFATDNASVGIGNPFEIAILLDTENDVNAVEAAFVIPSGLELVKTSNGNAIVSFWIEQPNYDTATRMLSFSGIIPGGYSGTGQLLKVTLKANVAGPITLSFDRARTAVYQNSPDGTLEPINVLSLALRAVPALASAKAPIADTAPPEAFTPLVARDSQLYDGAWTLVFATQDKGSGIAYYEVSESSARTINPNTLAWTKAESPYRLDNQTPARYIYVRAFDEQGNIRTELYTQERPFSWLDGLVLGILIGALILFIFWKRTKKRFYASL